MNKKLKGKNQKAKKGFIIGLVFIGIAFSSLYLIWGICFAAPAGNPAGPVLLDGNYPTRFNMEAEAVLERKLKSGFESTSNPKFSGIFYTAKISLYLGRKLDIYLLGGTYGGDITQFQGNAYRIKSKMDFAYGGGISYVLYELEFLGGILRLGADAKYRQFRPDIDEVKWYREQVGATDSALIFQEWQGSLGIAYQYKKVVPYVGVKYSDMDNQIKFTQGAYRIYDNTIASNRNVGVFYGTDIILGDGLSLNIEGRSIDEKAVNVGFSVRF